jgi:hypothetical protein
MRRLLAGGLAGLVVAAAVPAAASARLPSVLTQLKRPWQVKPAVIEYTGDGTGIVGGPNGTGTRHLGHIRWTTYNHRRAVGHGLVWLNDCLPDCADGTYHSAVVTMRVGSPKKHRFRRLTLTYTYQGKHYTDRRRAVHFAGAGGNPGVWAYKLV